MGRQWMFFLSLSIVIPTVLIVIRFRKIPESYFPLMALLVIGLLNEVVCYFFFRDSGNAPAINIYFLLECLLLIALFRNWRNILEHTALYYMLQGSLVLFWLTENVVFGLINRFTPFFLIVYSLTLVLLAINQLSWLVVNVKANIMLNSKFLICLAIIAYFSYKMLIEIFYYFAPSALTKSTIFDIHAYINVGYNLLLTLAILCIPLKRNFIRPSR